MTDMRKAEIIDGKVANVIEVDPSNVPDWCADWPEVTDAGIGWLYQGGKFIQPPAPQPTREQQESARRVAYTLEADPLFFLVQRGEANETEWLAKIAEIKTRYPYPNE